MTNNSRIHQTRYPPRERLVMNWEMYLVRWICAWVCVVCRCWSGGRGCFCYPRGIRPGSRSRLRYLSTTAATTLSPNPPRPNRHRGLSSTLDRLKHDLRLEVPQGNCVGAGRMATYHERPWPRALPSPLRRPLPRRCRPRSRRLRCPSRIPRHRRRLRPLRTPTHQSPRRPPPRRPPPSCQHRRRGSSSRRSRRTMRGPRGWWPGCGSS